MTQGERVKKIRKELNLTLEKFGKKLGVGKGAISAIENNNRNLTEQMAKAICREYSVNYDYLISGEGEMFDKLPETILDEMCLQYGLNDFDRAIIDIYVSLPAELRQMVKDKIQNIIANRDTKEQNNPDQSKNEKGN